MIIANTAEYTVYENTRTGIAKFIEKKNIKTIFSARNYIIPTKTY